MGARGVRAGVGVGAEVEVRGGDGMASGRVRSGVGWTARVGAPG